MPYLESLHAGFSAALGFARYTGGLPGFVRDPITLAQAETRIREGMASREAAFIAMLRRSVFSHAASPYRALFRATGCELGDVRRLVQQNGVEATLERLRDAGVSVSFDELKGRAPAVRGGRQFHFRPSDFENPLARGDIRSNSSGSSGRPTRIKVDLELVSQMAPHWAVWFATHGVLEQPLVFVHPSYPTAMVHHLIALGFGNRRVKWFQTGGGGSAAYRLATAYLHGITRCLCRFGPADPGATPDRVARYLTWLTRQGRRPGVNLTPSMAARISQAAGAAGHSLHGVTFLLGAEPLTRGRKESIEASGARATVTYGFSEGGNVGNQCDRATVADDVHVSLDVFTAIRGPASDEAGQAPLLFTTFRPASPLVLLNADIGDTAILEHRRCGCRFDALGYTLHLQSIRSLRKLTGDGVTFHDGDIIHALDALARRFGGGPADYQIVEEESATGLPCYWLLVSPMLGPIDEAALVEQFLSALAPQKPPYRFMVEQWRRMRVLRVRRAQPAPGLRGKIVPYRTLRHE